MKIDSLGNAGFDDLFHWYDNKKDVTVKIADMEIWNNVPHYEQGTLYEDVPWNMMKGIRNILAHEYFGVDLEIVWKTVKEDLPILKKRLL